MTDGIALIFKINNNLVARSLDGLSDEDMWQRPMGSGNPIGWLLGHVTGIRSTILGRLGAPFDTGWGSTFARGSQVQGPLDYPSRHDIEAQWKETHHRMRDAFASATPELLAQKLGRDLPGLPDPLIGEALAFFAFHESYHVGQMGYVKRLLGHSGVAG
jgi:uncharacterized damage-inducible protein DinB